MHGATCMHTHATPLRDCCLTNHTCVLVLATVGEFQPLNPNVRAGMRVPTHTHHTTRPVTISQCRCDPTTDNMRTT